MDDEIERDLDSEINEGREIDYLHKCAMRDMMDGINPNPTNWDNDDNE